MSGAVRAVLLLAALGVAAVIDGSREGMAGAAPGPAGARGAGQAQPPTWAALGPLQPLWVARSAPIMGQTLTADAANPRRIAYCAPGSIPITLDGGASWSGVSTAPVVAAAAATGFPLLMTGDVTPACVALALDPTAAAGLYAVFQGAPAGFGAPPVILLGLYTTDGGQSWQVVPPPSGAMVQQFGGFQVQGTAVQAMFGGGFVAQQTTDGGQTWTTVTPDCPSAGPCVRWGPAANMLGSCAMLGGSQPVEYSTDGGRTWTSAFPGPMASPNPCVLNQLAALSDTEVLLLREDGLVLGPDGALARLSRDGGQSWTAVTLPPLPGAPMRVLGGLQMLPDGALIAFVPGSGWQRLGPGADAWCAVPPAALPAAQGAADTVQVVGDRLWWLEDTDTGIPTANPQPRPRSAPLAGIQCATA
jgi:hypothetical protein